MDEGIRRLAFKGYPGSPLNEDYARQADLGTQACLLWLSICGPLCQELKPNPKPSHGRARWCRGWRLGETPGGVL